MLTVLSFCPSETGLNSEQPLGSDTIQTQEYKKTDLVICPGPEDYMTENKEKQSVHAWILDREQSTVCRETLWI